MIWKTVLTAGGPTTITTTAGLSLTADIEIIGSGSSLLTVERSHVPGTTVFTIFNNDMDHRIQFNGGYIAAEMVKAFISSGEYRQRFGSQ